MNILESIVFGLFSGLSDVMPVSSQAHKAMILKIFGERSENPILRLMIHVAILAALYYSCSPHITRILRQLKLSRIPKKKRRRPLDVQPLMEFRLLRTMIIPVLMSLLLYNKTAQWGTKLFMISIFLILNAVILYIPNLLPTGNKDARSMSGLEGLLMGFGASLSILPGVSSVAGALSVSSVCGAERSFALSITYLMQMILTVCLIGFDFAAVFAAGIAGLGAVTLIGYLLAALAAFFGAFIGIRAMRLLAVNVGFTMFAAYSFGAALLSFMLYLMV